MNAPRAVLAPVLGLAGVLAGCRCTASDPIATAQAWPEADALFHQDPRWLGADAAFTVPLGDGRVLWLFGDAFVATTPANVRSQSKMVRNTVAVQTGNDAIASAISFHWRGTGAPASYFPEDGDRWFWPGHGIRLGKALVVFLSRVRPTPGQGLGFEAEGWRAAVVDDASGPADAWAWRTVVPSGFPPGLVLAQGLNEVGGKVVALAIREPGDHAGYLVRWTSEDLAAGRIDAASWWAGSRGWVAAPDLGREPERVLGDAGPESSLHYDARLGRWVHVRSEGFGATTIVVSFASRVEGPWSAPKVVFTPPESSRADAFVYAAKGHPELAGADLVVTYATNTLADFGTLIADTSLYYPRFVRVSLRAP